MSDAYPSNLTPAQYGLLSDLLPEAKPSERPREVDLWNVLNAIFYILVEGVGWRSSRVCYRVLINKKAAPTYETLLAALCMSA